MINTLGLTQGLDAAAEGLQSGYMNALGTIYSRNLAQQKQTSESNLQNSQADYFAGRNSSALQVADARRQGMIDAYKVRAQGQTDAATINNLKYLPTFEQATAGMSPEVAAQNAAAYDQKFGTNLRSLFAAGDPSAGAGSGSPTLPTLGTLPAPSLLPAPSMSFSAPGVSLSGLGMNTPPASSITGVSSALPPPSGPIGASSLGNTPSAPVPSLGSGVLPTLPPPSGPIGSQPPAPASSGATMPSLPPSGPLGNPSPSGLIGAGVPLKNPFSPSPLTVSQINKNNAGANGTLSKTDMAFQNSVGLLPPTQQAQATARFNQINGTNYAVPGMRNPTLPDGTPVLGPPTLTPSYTPNALQASTIAGKNAQTSALGQNYGLKVQQFKSLQDYQNALVAAKQQEIGLQRQGLSEKTAHDSVMASIAQQGVNARGNSLGGSGVAGDALTARLNERVTQLTMPGKPDMFGKASAPLVTLDTNGNPTGPGAHEYHQLQSMLRGGPGGATLPANPAGGGYHLIPGVGSQVRGVSGPAAPPLPNFPSRLPGAGTGAGDMLTINGRTATRAQWAAEMAKPGRR